MKLFKLIAGGFGVLSGRTIDLGGRSTVLYGRNEAGKTSFIDALLDALYGERPKGPRSAGDRVWVARYGETPVAASIELATAAGARKTSATTQPIGKEFAESSLARAVLILRAGETAMAATLDFIPAFIAKVAGGTTVSISDAVETVATFMGRTRGSRMSKYEAALTEKIIALSTRLGSAGELEELTKQESKAQAREKVIKDNLAQESAVEVALAKAGDRRRVGVLEVRLATLAQADALIQGAGALDTKLYETARACEQERTACANHLSVAGTLLAQAGKRVSETDRGLQAVRDEQARQPSGEKRTLLKLKFDERKIAEQAALAGGKDQTGILRVAFATVGALLVGGVLWLVTGKAALALLGAVAGAAAGFFAGGLFASSKAASVDSREGMARLRGAIDDMGEDWRGLSPEEAEKRLVALEDHCRDLSLNLTRGGLQLETERAALRTQEDDVRATEADQRRLEEDLKEKLQRLGSASLDECAQRLARLDQARVGLAAGVKEAADLLGANVEGLEAVQTQLRVRLQQLQQSSEGADATLVALGDAALDERGRESQARKRKLESEMQTLEAQLRHVNQSKGVLLERIGGSLVEVHRMKLRAEAALVDLQEWRKAAGIAKDELERFSMGIEGQVRVCVASAGPLFSAMSGETYNGLRLKEGADLNNDGLEVEHAIEGWKPFPWMSTGACDLLWLALRISFARQAFPEPSFLVLDEPFHSLDAERATNALRCLAQSPESAGWQLIILTKDEAIAAGAVAAGLARVDLTA